MFFPDEPIPLEVVRELSAMLTANGLSELTLESKQDDNALRLSLGRETRIYAVAPAPAAATSAIGEFDTDEAIPSEILEQGSAPVSATIHEIAAPCVGVYRAPKKPLQIGDSVRSGQVIAVVESLHVPNEVTAPFDATVLELPALEGQGVEWGQTLLVLEPAS